MEPVIRQKLPESGKSILEKSGWLFGLVRIWLENGVETVCRFCGKCPELCHAPCRYGNENAIDRSF